MEPNQMQVKKLAQLTGHKAAVFALVQGKEACRFFSAAGDGWVAEWDLNDPDIGKLVAQVDTQIFSMAYLHEHNKLVIGNMHGGVHWVDLLEPGATKNIAHHQKGVFAVLPVGEHVFTLGGSGMITRWSAAESRSLESLHLTNRSLRAIDYSPQRNELAVGASDHAIYLLDADTFSIKRTLPKAHENSVFSLCYTLDGTRLLSGGRDAHLKLWDLENEGELLWSSPAHWYTINSIVLDPQGRWFATGSRDKTIKIWDLKTRKLLKVLESVRDRGHVNSVNALLWSNHHNCLISAGDDRSLIVWGVASA
jgi:WD40 repeat protein